MTKVKTFLHVFTNSFVPSAKYYHKIFKTKFTFSLSYFLALICILNILFTLLIAIKLNPFKINAIMYGLEKSLAAYPTDLMIDIKNETLHSSYDRPYFFWLDFSNVKRLIIVVDENAAPEKIDEYNAHVLLTKQEIVFKDNLRNKKFDTIDYKNLDNTVISKGLINNVRDTVLNINRMFFLLYPLGFLLVLLFLTITSLITTFLYLLIASGVVYLFFIFIRKKVKPQFKKTLQISLHSVTLPLLLNYIFVALNLKFNILPNLFLLLVIIFTAVGLHEAHNLSLHHHSHPKK